MPVPAVVGMALEPGHDVRCCGTHFLVAARTPVCLAARTADVPYDEAVFHVLADRGTQRVVVARLESLQRGGSFR